MGVVVRRVDTPLVLGPEMVAKLDTVRHGIHLAVDHDVLQAQTRLALLNLPPPAGEGARQNAYV